MKIVLMVAVVAAFVVVAAGWKWSDNKGRHAQGTYKIAGWSWGDGQTTQGVDPGNNSDAGWSWGDGQTNQGVDSGSDQSYA